MDNWSYRKALWHGHIKCLKAWIESGGSIHDGCHNGLDDTLIAAVSSMTGKHPCIHVTKASLSLMHQGSLPQESIPAFHNPRGRALAERMVPAFTDPIKMGQWIQVIANHGSV
jgi:hypothetical protein